MHSHNFRRSPKEFSSLCLSKSSFVTVTDTCIFPQAGRSANATYRQEATQRSEKNRQIFLGRPYISLQFLSDPIQRSHSTYCSLQNTFFNGISGMESLTLLYLLFYGQGLKISSYLFDFQFRKYPRPRVRCQGLTGKRKLSISDQNEFIGPYYPLSNRGFLFSWPL